MDAQFIELKRSAVTAEKIATATVAVDLPILLLEKAQLLAALHGQDIDAVFGDQLVTTSVPPRYTMFVANIRIRNYGRTLAQVERIYVTRMVTSTFPETPKYSDWPQSCQFHYLT
jgi:hypothetical protein